MLGRADGEPKLGRLLYRRSEYSFDVDPRLRGGVASLLVNDVQIEIDEDGHLMYAWGLCPEETWNTTVLEVPSAAPGRLLYHGEIVPGVSKRLNEEARWIVSRDLSTGWLCIGDETAREEAIAFAPDAIAALADSNLVALWLHPEMTE